MINQPTLRLSIFLLGLLLVSCENVQKVEFETYVDTTSKEIKKQPKKTFVINELGVSASNLFDGARLNNFSRLNDSTVVAFVEPENTPINNSAYFAFDIWAEDEKPIYIQFKYPEGYQHRYHPKIKTHDTWSILDSSKVVSKIDTAYTIRLDLSKEKMPISAQEVHSSTTVRSWYTKLAETHSSKVEVKTIGSSTLGKDMVVLDISNGTVKDKPIIVLLTRQHPPEVTGYFAFREFLKTILSDQISDSFLEKYHVLAFPLMNPDGVDLGHWRHNAGGVDTNRDWSQYNQPEIKTVVTYITQQSKKNNAKIVLGLDFHSTWYDIFYTNKKREGTTLPTFVSDWFTALESNIANYKVNEAPGNSKKPVSKGWFLYGHNATGITYEIGDETPRDKIQQIGKVSAQQMMQILLKE